MVTSLPFSILMTRPVWRGSSLRHTGSPQFSSWVCSWLSLSFQYKALNGGSMTLSLSFHG
jgi:hypothetical protein